MLIEFSGELSKHERYKILHLLPLRKYPKFYSNIGSQILKRFDLHKVDLPKSENSILYLKGWKRVKIIDFSSITLTSNLVKYSKITFKRVSRSCSQVVLNMTNFDAMSAIECQRLQARLCDNLSYITNLNFIHLIFSGINDDIIKNFQKLIQRQ